MHSWILAENEFGWKTGEGLDYFISYKCKNSGALRRHKDKRTEQKKRIRLEGSALPDLVPYRYVCLHTALIRGHAA